MEEGLDLEAMRVNLHDWFKSKLPRDSEIILSPLKRPGDGMNETFFVELQLRQGGETIQENMVIRWPPREISVFPKYHYDMKKQHMLLERLWDTVVPVPRVRWLEEDESVLGGPFYIMERVEGWIPGEFPPYHIAGPLFEATYEEKADIWWKAVDTIANIHTLDWEKAGLNFLGVPRAGTDFMERQIAYFEEIYALNNEPMPPVLKATRDWLLKNSFEPKYISLCWGDARLGNMIINKGEVAAVLDWEMVLLGDPESDLGWFVHMDWATSVGRPDSPFPRLPGLPDMKETIAHYEKVTNRKVENLFYYEVFATWRMAIFFTRMEQDARYIARSKRAKGFITMTHYEKLRNLLGL